MLLARGLTPVLLGGGTERDLTAAIATAAPGSRDLAGETGLADLVALGRGAALAIGNDTGPMHVLGVAGAPAIVLFSNESDPALCAPRGPQVTVLQRPRLDDLPVESVLERL